MWMKSAKLYYTNCSPVFGIDRYVDLYRFDTAERAGELERGVRAGERAGERAAGRSSLFWVVAIRGAHGEVEARGGAGVSSSSVFPSSVRLACLRSLLIAALPTGVRTPFLTT